MMPLPTDAAMLLSFVNVKLRDFYPSLEELCEDLEADEAVITEKLGSIDYHYNKERNQFV